MTEQSANNQKKLDVNSLFPSKGDPRRPPEWYGRALFYAVIAVYLGWFAFTSWGKITYIVFDIIIALFLALAVEPLVIRLIKHGWKRAVASVTCLVGLLVIVVVLLGLFGNMFVQQLISMVKGLPDLYNQFAALIAEKTQFKLPEMNMDALTPSGNMIFTGTVAFLVIFSSSTGSRSSSFRLSITEGVPETVTLNGLTVALVTFSPSASSPL